MDKVYRIVDRYGRESEDPYHSLETARSVLMTLQDWLPSFSPYFILEYPA